MEPIGAWVAREYLPVFGTDSFPAIINTLRRPLHVIYDAEQQRMGLAIGGQIFDRTAASPAGAYSLMASLPALYPEWLGDCHFQHIHGVRFSYVGGAMARGIASVELVIQLARAGMLAFFGAAGLRLEQVEAEILRLKQALEPLGLPFGSNLIHSPNQPALEEQLTALYLRLGVRRICASAFMTLSKHVVWYAAKGLTADAFGVIQRHNYVFAKISRPEVAEHFMAPAPQHLLQQLVDEGKLTALEAQLASQIPVAEDITVESDSGGHTDNRPLNALFPAISQLRESMMARYQYAVPIRLGAAGSLGTPQSVAAAYALGAAYVLLGTVHQAAVESGLSPAGKTMLATADVADVMMAPAADMFEMGVKVQVLRKGTMMGIRGNQLYDLYRRYEALDDIPPTVLDTLEKNVFKMSVSAVWDATVAYFSVQDPSEIERAEKNPKRKMALVFCWYLGNTSRWPLTGQTDRQADYQIWCGPAMGAFNRWVKGSFLEVPEQRHVVQIALNLLEGAAIVSRAQQLRTYGVLVPYQAFDYRPVPMMADVQQQVIP